MDIQTLMSSLKTKYPQSGLSDNEIKGLAASLFATGLVTDENVSAIVDAQADTMKSFQSLFDSRFTSQKNTLTNQLTEQLEKAFKEKYRIGDDGIQVKEQEPPKDDVAAMVAKLLDEKLGEKLKPITDRITAEDERRSQEQRTNEIVEAARKNGIAEELARMLNVPGDVKDLDSYMKDKAQQLTNFGFQKSVPPGTGNDEDSEGKTFAEQIRAGAPKKEDGK